MILRDYQQRAIDSIYAWFGKNKTGNVCAVLPTGAGKSIVIAALCRDAIQQWPETRILMMSHVRELLEQNSEKMRAMWPGAPLGIYSASLRKRNLEEPITFAGIQSVRNKSKEIGHVDLVIIDECFVAGTKISTPSGQKDIDKVRCGDVVYNLSGSGVVEAVSCKPAKDIYKLEFDNGRSIECTPNHPFFTTEGWKRAQELENGSYILSLESVSSLWSDVQSLDEEGREREDFVGNAGASMGKAEFLLREVCKEIQPDGAECAGEKKDQRHSEGDKAQTYKALRKRAIAAFATAGATPCARRGMDCRAPSEDACGSQEQHISECVQGRYCKSREDDSYRAGWTKPLNSRETESRQEEIGASCVARVVSISRVEREGTTHVYNLQVSGHPSFFANGLAVHNCHLVNHKAEGGYRTLIEELTTINPELRVIGLTATPHRLGHGLITDKPAIFDDLLESVTIEELIHKGYLANLRSKVTKEKLSTDGVHKRGGDFIESELQAAVDTDAHNMAVVDEVIGLAGNRRHWLFFCAGVQHAVNIRDQLRLRGISAETVTGETPQGERAQIIADFKAGKIQALTNANVLTTGFDAPNIDLIAMLRPTMSPSLYIQMAGRGLRQKAHTDHCLVLDFAGVVETHGPITNVRPPKKASEEKGEAPVKDCPECGELVHISVMMCPACGHAFPEREAPDLKLGDVDIMGLEGTIMNVTSWIWREHTSRTSGKQMVKVTYYGALSDAPVTEYMAVLHDGFAGQKAARELAKMASEAGVAVNGLAFAELAHTMTSGTPPSQIEYFKEGKFYRVKSRKWSNDYASRRA